MSGSDVYYSLKIGKRLEKPIYCPSSIHQIMLKCWEWDENKRPTFHQLVQLLKNEFDSGLLSRTSRQSTVLDGYMNEQTIEQYKINHNDHESKHLTTF